MYHFSQAQLNLEEPVALVEGVNIAATRLRVRVIATLGLIIRFSGILSSYPIPPLLTIKYRSSITIEIKELIERKIQI